ncbi:MAG TPA: hypothetical protein VKC53_04480 [Patescibacteria group bacterium]|nr:hypothetical protein [Patescibacteria group bacterium]
MNKAVSALLARLSYGTNDYSKDEDFSHGFVETLANVYETARNALEYRADNLVRRAAIERILKRRIFLDKNPESLSSDLLLELKWARYLPREKVEKGKKEELIKILEKYTSYKGTVIPPDWIVKIASAEIEDLFNLNRDYNQFTFFAFQVIKQKIAIPDENLDLFVYFATDKIFAGSDNEQIAYHIISLAGQNIDSQKLEEGWKLFNLARESKLVTKINKFVRRQMPPLILLRDMYFYAPSDFKNIITSKDKFIERSEIVLKNQLEQMSDKISTAGIRSIIYVFLTKMILAFGLEVPFEIFFYGSLAKLPLIINIIFPPLLMWITTMQIKVPGTKEREALVHRTWYVVENFDQLKDEEDILIPEVAGGKTSLGYYIFSVLYAVFFVGIFGLMFYVLGLIGYRFFSKLIFIFFLTIIAFLAYRISQIAKAYFWKDQGREKSSITDMIYLPILTIGSQLSKTLSKLNFLGFVFDFILEAPFKLILGLVDGWVQFLSIKKEEQILE